MRVRRRQVPEGEVLEFGSDRFVEMEGQGLDAMKCTQACARARSCRGTDRARRRGSHGVCAGGGRLGRAAGVHAAPLAPVSHAANADAARSQGYNGIKVALPTEITTGTQYLKMYIDHILAFEVRRAASPPAAPLRMALVPVSARV